MRTGACAPCLDKTPPTSLDGGEGQNSQVALEMNCTLWRA